MRLSWSSLQLPHLGNIFADLFFLTQFKPHSDTLYYVENYEAIKQLQDTLAFKFCEDIGM